MLFVGIAILIVLFISSTMIEKSLNRIEKQNELIIELLKEKSFKN
ncbi:MULTISPECIES: hypothetical protein [Bacillus]|uniref:Uncharacterized protein n=1 Tax=Bacillus pumilus TaxID=1408 RepID=A0AB34R035_BACPU|nr:hypothetical protein [Bacillus pumilus]KIL25480.1 hypothetical protein B4127_4056 [Bacillus pumilus]RAP09327.1 hypothetical protein C2W58_00620 [Bacillus pumilus]